LLHVGTVIVQDCPIVEGGGEGRVQLDALRVILESRIEIAQALVRKSACKVMLEVGCQIPVIVLLGLWWWNA
jgi:hypothetical protein